MKFKVGSSDVESDEYSASDPMGRIDQMLTGSPVFLFMKGNPESPQCGFSSKVTVSYTHLTLPTKRIV